MIYPSIDFFSVITKNYFLSLTHHIPGVQKRTGPKKNALKRSKIKIIICKFVNLGPDSVKFADYIFISKPLFKRSESRFCRKACFWLLPLANQIKSDEPKCKKIFQILIQRIRCLKLAQSLPIDCSLVVCN